jgi:hypothetical protein
VREKKAYSGQTFGVRKAEDLVIEGRKDLKAFIDRLWSSV